jgi:hypothetical protein
MKHLLLVSILLSGISNICLSQKPIRKGMPPLQQASATPVPRYGIGQLNGKWQEQTRIDRSTNKALSFTDTLQLNFKGNNAELREGSSMSMYMKGTAQIEGVNTLNVAGDSYTINSLSRDRLVIDDGEFIRVLNKTKQFHFETLGNAEVKQAVYLNPVIADPSNLKGKWIVYRRQAEPGMTDKSFLIKSIEIITDSAGKYASGNISFYQKDITQKENMLINFADGKSTITSPSHNWNFFSYKADGNEWVFGMAGELLYYAKKL